MNTLSQLLDTIGQHARQFPQGIACRCWGCPPLTYGELWDRSGQLARQLAGLSLPGGRPVAIWGTNGENLPVAILSCLRAGLCYLPLDSALPPLRVKQLLGLAQPSLILSCKPVGWTGEIPCLELSQWDRQEESQAPLPHPLPDQLPAYLLYTSGSTGTPKGVLISRGNLAAFCQWALPLLFPQPGRDDVVINQAPYSFDLSVMGFFPALLAGAQVFDLPASLSEDFPGLFSALRESGATHWVSTPSFASLCLRDPSFCQALLPQLRRFFFCGETLSPILVNQLAGRFPKGVFYNSYGPTEATVAICACPVAAGHTGPLPVGRVAPHCQVYLLDGQHKPVPEGQPGEIFITGESVALGYWNDPEKTAGSFPSLWVGESRKRGYLTGDMGYFKEGQLYFLRRLDNQLKHRGYRIEPGEIQHHLLALPQVEQAVVLPPAKPQGPLRAFVVLAQGSGETPLSLKRQLASRLPDYLIPGRIILLDKIPLTFNGKIDQKKLEEMENG